MATARPRCALSAASTSLGTSSTCGRGPSIIPPGPEETFLGVELRFGAYGRRERFNVAQDHGLRLMRLRRSRMSRPGSDGQTPRSMPLEG